MPKAPLRGFYKQKRKEFIAALSRAEYETLLHKILGNLLLLPLPLRLGAFWPKDGEINIRPILESLSKQGHEVALPFARADFSMAFYQWKPNMPLHPDHYGILSPIPQSEAVVPAGFLVPLVSFDLDCHRLGQGAGYYDRYFSQLPDKFLTVGIALEVQKHATLPKHKHDIQLDYVVTEKTIYRKSV